VSVKILVTGSQGFVGHHLRAALEARNCEVVGVDRPGTGAEIEVDLSDLAFAPGTIAQSSGAVHAIISMAATITRGSSVDALARQNLRCIAEAHVRLWESYSEQGLPTPHQVYCSTYKTYGPAESQPIDPSLPPQRPDPHSYGCAKSLAERLLAIASTRLEAPYAIVRPTCIYGPGQHLHNAIPLFLKAALGGDSPVIYGDGTSVRDDVIAPDLAFCLAEAAVRKATGAFHATGERARTILEVAEVACAAMEQLGFARGLQPVREPSKVPKWWLNQSFDLTRSREHLNYQPTPLIEGITWEAQWMKQGANRNDTVRFCPPPRVITGA